MNNPVCPGKVEYTLPSFMGVSTSLSSFCWVKVFPLNLNNSILLFVKSLSEFTLTKISLRIFDLLLDNLIVVSLTLFT